MCGKAGLSLERQLLRTRGQEIPSRAGGFSRFRGERKTQTQSWGKDREHESGEEAAQKPGRWEATCAHMSNGRIHRATQAWQTETRRTIGGAQKLDNRQQENCSENRNGAPLPKRSWLGPRKGLMECPGHEKMLSLAVSETGGPCCSKDSDVSQVCEGVKMHSLKGLHRI